MKNTEKNVKIAVVQAAPSLFDKQKTIDKAIELIKEASQANAKFIIFPESFIPAYPRGFSYGYVVGTRTMEGREDWKRYYDNSVMVPSIDTESIGKAAAEANAYVCMGVTERDELNCTLYCTYLFFGPDGSFLGKHRKLKPTGTERLIWGEGHGHTLTTIDTPYGIVGSLICWENYMPLARAAMYQKGVSIYLAPTADSREEWQCTMRHIALEGRCFVIGCNQYVTKDMYPTDFNYQHELENYPGNFCPGGSCIVDPFGKYVVAPVWDREEILYADLNLDLVPLSRMDFDPTGHYSRPDVLELIIHE
ncbi:MAG: carbon-nitrogen hydrolase family protein [Sporomusaceae bacterium]|nr:carbon-nitrogen hydrolase family protein [Sporomusaceae bacterium]